MRIVLFIIAFLIITSKCALYERSGRTIDETREEVADKASEKYHQGKDYVSEKIEEVGDTVKEVYHKAKDISSEKIDDIKDSVGGTFEKVKNVGKKIIGKGSDTVENVKDSVSGGYENIKDYAGSSADVIGEKVQQGKEAVKDVYYTGKRKFNKATNILEDVYNIGWDKLDRMYRGGKFKLYDFKDLLGDRYDEVAEYLGEKVEQGKEAITPGNSKKFRNIYEILWDNIDEMVTGGKITADQVKNFFGDKYEDVKQTGKEALDLDTSDIERWKNTLLEWKNQYFQPEDTSWWTSIKNKLMGRPPAHSKGVVDFGWEVLNQLINSKKLNLEDLRDLLGDKYELVSEALKSGNLEELSKGFGGSISNFYTLFKDHVEDFFEGDNFNGEYLYEVLVGFIPDSGVGGRSKQEITQDIDSLKNVIIQLKESFIGESHPQTYWEKFKGQVESAKDTAKEKLGLSTKTKTRRIFDKVTNNLEPLYNMGWEKLDYFFRNGKLGLEDFKDLLGDRYQDVYNFLSEKIGGGKEGIKDILQHGKRIARSPERLRDIYELLWDYVDEQYRKGSIGFEQIKDLIGDNFDNIADTIVSGIDKGKDVIKETAGTDKYDADLERFKRKVLELKNTLSEHSEGGFWGNFVNMLNNLKEKALGGGNRKDPHSKSSSKSSRSRDNQDTSSTEL